MKGIQYYGATNGKRNSAVLFVWLTTVTQVSPASFGELCRFLKSLTPLTVNLDRECVLKVMDLINRVELRSVHYLESFMDVMSMFDTVLLQLLGLAKRDRTGLRKFFEDEGSRLGLVMDMDMAWNVVDEQHDMAKHIGSVVLLARQSRTAAAAFRKTKSDVVTSHLSYFVTAQIQEWVGRHVNSELVQQTRQFCLDEASAVSCDLWVFCLHCYWFLHILHPILLTQPPLTWRCHNNARYILFKYVLALTT